MISSEIQYLLNLADESHDVTKEQALECYQWAEELMQAVKGYLVA